MNKELLKKLIDWDLSTPAALCSQVAWKGSVPRKDYPSMLVMSDGTALGTVGGGAMENLVIGQAVEALRNGSTKLTDFDMSSDDVEGEAGVCGGWTRMLIEPVTEPLIRFMKALSDAISEGETTAVLTAVSSDPAVVERSILDGKISSENLPEKVRKLVDQAHREERSLASEVEGASYLIEILRPVPHLHIFGAGHVGSALAEIARFVEMNVCIYDDRPDLANSERFPFAVHIDSGSFDDLDARAKIGHDDFVVIATRGHQYDLHMLRWLLRREVSYLGMMSSRRKWALIEKTLLSEGVSKQELSRIHVPIGLDLNAETVPEIAVSIISEIIHHARTHRRSDSSMTVSRGNVHE